MTYTLYKDQEDNFTLSRMFVDLMHKHTGLSANVDKFIDRTVTLRVQPLTGQHVAHLPVDQVVDYLKQQHAQGKTQVLFFGADEMLQDFALEKVQAVAEQVQNLFDHMVYLIDEINVEIYSQWCKQHNKKPVLTVLGGVHFAFHSPDEYPEQFDDQPAKPYHFLFYSRMPRTVRIQMLGAMIRDNILHKGLVSAFPQSAIDSVKQDPIPGMPELEYLIKNEKIFPLTLDTETPWQSTENLCSVIPSNVQHRNNSYFSLVSETAFYDNGYQGMDISHLGGRTFTEKTFRPMIIKHPFVLLARANSLRTLHEYGFQTFNTWWDESYDSIENNRQRFLTISNLVKQLCSIGTEEWDAMIADMEPVLNHNFELMRKRPFNFISTTDMSCIKDFLKV